MLVWVLIVLGFLALLNPGYSSVYVEGPTGVIQTHRFTFGPGSLIVFTWVEADESSVKIEQR
jgi:hypothetical protein